MAEITSTSMPMAMQRLENPEILQRMVKETGAKSTDLQSPETAEHLCSKCVPYANTWKPYADKIWSETPKTTRSYENYEKKE